MAGKRAEKKKQNVITSVIAAVILIALIAAVAVIITNAPSQPGQIVEEEPGLIKFEDIIATDSETLRFHLLNKDIRWVATAVACEATVGNDAGKCDIIADSSSRKWCNDEYEDYKLILDSVNAYTSGDCSILASEPAEDGLLDEDVCTAIKQRTCSGLTGNKEIFCRAVLEDPSRCNELENLTFCLRNFALSRAYILGNAELCQVEGLSISQVEACKGIVRQDCQDSFNRLSSDLSKIDYIKRNEEKSKCDTMQTQSLREACVDDSLNYMEIYNRM